MILLTAQRVIIDSSNKQVSNPQGAWRHWMIIRWRGRATICICVGLCFPLYPGLQKWGTLLPDLFWGRILPLLVEIIPGSPKSPGSVPLHRCLLGRVAVSTAPLRTGLRFIIFIHGTVVTAERRCHVWEVSIFSHCCVKINLDLGMVLLWKVKYKVTIREINSFLGVHPPDPWNKPKVETWADKHALMFTAMLSH